MTKHSSKTFVTSADLREFFQDLLTDAASNQDLNVSPLAMGYVTELLVTFHETARLFDQRGVKIPVLADMLAEALEADFYRRITLLRQLGDTSLMMSGYFPEALNRRCLDLNYYQRMGELAYSHVNSLNEELSIFNELSDRFIRVASVINEVSEQTLEKDYSVLKLLEFYMNTNSEQVLEKLKKQNIVPLKSKRADPDGFLL